MESSVCIFKYELQGVPEKNVRLQEGNSACKRTFFLGHLVFMMLFILIVEMTPLNFLIYFSFLGSQKNVLSYNCTTFQFNNL